MTNPTDVPRLTKAQLRELAAARQQGAWPDCFICGSVVLNHQLAHGPEYTEQRIAVCVPCGHCLTYNVNIAAQAQSEVNSGAATEATEPGICPKADALCAELYRRASHLQTLNADSRRWDHVYGETIGLRGAIGIVLGHEVTGSADEAGQAYYRAWLERTGGQA
jgi:hypothetical protein